MDGEFISKTVVTDINSIKVLRSQAAKREFQALKKAASQFEALFVQKMMQSMRQSNDFLPEDSPLKSKNTRFFQEMLDKQQAMDISNNGGIGLGDILVQQLRKHTVEKKSEGKNLPSTHIGNQIQSHMMSKDALVITPHTFIKTLWPIAKEYAEQLQVDPKLLIAQAALETGWGKHINESEEGDHSYNLFNIKNSKGWLGKTMSVMTTEYFDDKPLKMKDEFRQYESYGESFQDYVNLLKGNKRYQEALKHTEDPEHYIQALQEAGYATDPHYAKKVLSIFNGDFLMKSIRGLEDNLWQR